MAEGTAKYGYPQRIHVTGIKKMTEKIDFDQIVSNSKKAQAEWKELSFKERAKRLKPLGKALSDRADEISNAISSATGKTSIDALSAEVLPSSLAVGFYCGQSAKYLKPKKLRGGSILFFNKSSCLYHEPYGVIGIISPWNYPFAIPFQEMLMALIAGNSCVLKVARQCQNVGEIIESLMKDLDLPENLFQLVNIPGSQAGKAFIHSEMDKIFFTGSNPVGKELAKLAAENLKPLSLELGGNDGMIVLKDANLERAAAGACWAGLSNCGQSCGGVERIYVEEAVYEEFAAILRAKVSSLRQEYWKKERAELGSLATAKQLETVKRHVQDALEKGAIITARSQSPAEEIPKEQNVFFHEAILLENVTHDMITMKEETFGPLLALCSVKDREEAVKRVNDSYLGLTASVWTSNKKNAAYCASRLEAGAITINDHLMSHGLAETPWGGYKQSSIGRSHGTPGLEEVTQLKVVIQDSLGFLPRQMWWYPHDRSIYKGLKSVMALVFGPRRLKGLMGTIKIFMRSFTKD
jgi:acyl-CoA reductase-like NAD-dependent aldehyde dehydrogenase